MCDECAKFYKSAKKHDPSVCPIAQALTCSCCKVRGHATLKCPNLTLWQSRVPEYIEQLIPHDLKIHYGIPFDSMTPIKPNPRPPSCPHRLIELTSERMECARDPKKVASIETGNCNLCRPTLEIPEDKDGGSHTANIRATLASYNLPSSSAKDNKKLLETFAAIKGMKTIFITKTKIVEPIQKDETIKKTIKKEEVKEEPVKKKAIKLKVKPGAP
jgi:hypothetical protein